MKNLYKLCIFVVSILISIIIFSCQASAVDGKIVDITKLSLFKKEQPSTTEVKLGSSIQDVLMHLGEPTLKADYFMEMDDKMGMLFQYGSNKNNLYFVDDKLDGIDLMDFENSPITVGSTATRITSSAVGSSYESLYGKLQNSSSSSFHVLVGKQVVDVTAMFFYESKAGKVTKLTGVSINPIH